jgi:hypothetical protein
VSAPAADGLTLLDAARMIREFEPWLDKHGLAEHLQCSVRSIDTAKAEGMPHAVIFGRVKFRVTEVEPWLEQNGYLKRHGDERAA